jgi:hypothetical protein
MTDRLAPGSDSQGNRDPRRITRSRRSGRRIGPSA